MQDLIYHVAMTLDGYIARPDGSAPGFVMTGPHVDAYQRQLGAYAAVVMGRATYEIGYAYGMKPGDLPYGRRPHHVFSRSIDLPEREHLHIERAETLATIDRIKADAKGPIYLCGGGRLAGCLLEHRRIDILRLKLAPITYGSGIRIFEGSDGLGEWDMLGQTNFGNGHMLLEYRRK
ncbi:Dihydrofolate reductase [Devosia lucknowensis]|uniref:Dihydrofolate reductase n=1 Tax=Devosia lucknowensis TaxID=1096929 RepID=A0A1Y6FAR3_9HYPH|nr:dihydrofolate reductase family protein [Devosia lucknowensis]SMQ71994.1 Dihydrofolate reductase [Devosia lucknowensis]